MAQVTVSTHHPFLGEKFTNLGVDDTGGDDFPTLFDVQKALGGYHPPATSTRVPAGPASEPSPAPALPVYDTMDAAVQDAIKQSVGGEGGGGEGAGPSGDAE